MRELVPCTGNHDQSRHAARWFDHVTGIALHEVEHRPIRGQAA